MTPEPRTAAEPRPLGGDVVFEEGDFHALSADLAGDAQFNDRRLVTRRKLLTLGKSVASEIGAEGPRLDCRSSLHNPTVFNGMRVRRLWSYLTRAKAEKRRLRTTLGAELAKDLDAAYRNAYLCLAIEADGLEVGYRIHADAWFDGQNLKNRVEREEGGLARWLALLNELRGFRLQLADWKGEWRCGELTTERLEEFLSYYTPGEHLLAVERKWPAPPGARGGALDPGAVEEMRRETLRLVPLYRFASWSQESDFLFGG